MTRRGGTCIIRSAAGNSVSPESAGRAAEIIQELSGHFSPPDFDLLLVLLGFLSGGEKEGQRYLSRRKKTAQDERRVVLVVLARLSPFPIFPRRYPAISAFSGASRGLYLLVRGGAESFEHI